MSASADRREGSAGSGLMERLPRMWLTSAGSNVASSLVKIASLAVLGRLLVPADFGLIGMVMAIFGVAGILQGMGLAGAVIRADSLSQSQSTTLFLINVSLGVIFSSAAFLSASALASIYADERVVEIARFLAWQFLIGALGMQQGALLRRQLKFRVLAVINLASVVIGQGGAVAVALGGHGYWALVFGLLATSLSKTILVWYFSDWRFSRPSFDRGVLKLVQFGGWLTIFAILNFFAMNVHSAVLGAKYGSHEAGEYGRAFALFTMLTGLIAGPLAIVAPAALARLKQRPEEFSQTYLDTMAMQMFMTAPMSVFCFSFASELIAVLLGKGWEVTAFIFQLLAVSAMPQAICASSGWLYMAHGDAKRMMQWGLGGWSSMIALICFGAYSGGGIGVALAYSATMYVLVYPCMLLAFKKTELSFMPLLRDILPIAFAAALAGAVNVIMKPLTAALHPIVVLIISLPLYLCAYLALLLFVFGQKQRLTILFRRIWVGA